MRKGAIIRTDPATPLTRTDIEDLFELHKDSDALEAIFEILQEITCQLADLNQTLRKMKGKI